MSDKPSYLGLLNAIAVGEGRAHTYLRAWAETTRNPDVRRVIETVAIREGEHALAFEKRICALGYSLRKQKDETLVKTLALVTSTRSDLEKFEDLGLGGSVNEERDDPFSAVLVGVDSPWDVCLLKLFRQIMQDSGGENVRELSQRRLFEQTEGIPNYVRQEVDQAFLAASRDPSLIKPLGAKLQKLGVFAQYQDRFFSLMRG